MRSRLLVLIALLVLGALIASAPASASSRDARVKKKVACSLKKKAKCKKAKISKQKFGRQNLSGADLSGSTITGTTFAGTNLSGVNLSKATLRDVTFTGTNLAGVNLTGARLVNVDFVNTKATAARRAQARQAFCGFTADSSLSVQCYATAVDFSGTTFAEVTFTSSVFMWASFAHSSFNNVTFSMNDLTGASFIDSRFTSTTFSNNDMNSVLLQSVKGGVVSYSGSAGIDGRLRGASILGSTGLKFTPALTATDSVRGRNGAATLLVSPGSGSPTYLTIGIDGTWGSKYYTDWTECHGGSGTCRAGLANGDHVRTTIVSTMELVASGHGMACSTAQTGANFTTTCDGDIRGETTITYAAVPPPTMRTITVNVSAMGSPTLSAITISTVSGGTVTTVKQCADAATCVGSVVDGSTVRVSGSLASQTAWVTGLCLGETNWANIQTGTAPPNSVLTCPDTVVTSDVTATFEAS